MQATMDQVKDALFLLRFGEPVVNEKDLIKRLERKTSGGLMIEGLYEDVPGVEHQAIGW